MKTVDLRNSSNQDFFRRPVNSSEVCASVEEICLDVLNSGDLAVREYAYKFDSFEGESFRIDEQSIGDSIEIISSEALNALIMAKENIEKFHALQLPKNNKTINQQGVELGTSWKPLNRVGLYIPGGTAPLISTVLMLAIPAKIAGVREIVAITPSNSVESVNPALLAAFNLCGIQEVYCLGGAQGIAALGFGTESISQVEKIFGPGNQFVDRAKAFVRNASSGVDTDMDAGPSEVLIIADKYANSTFVAADLLAQLEHGPDSSAILLTDSLTLVEEVENEVKRLTQLLKRECIIESSLENLNIGLVRNIDQAILISEDYAPEHLILNLKNSDDYLDRIRNAGSIFLGDYTPETLGDYLSGTNHVLPTNGQARFRAGISTLDYMKKITWQKASPDSLKASLKSLEVLADLEGLDAHKLAAQVRFL
ncbi:MAG: histidinol dehydrogenase [Bacteriovoracaceae bacterium]|nr:histidinol dehydrogenase [Bacteriovoracaceae bacterium]